jgi:drug/metabolite transporter (DMT)-like permease
MSNTRVLGIAAVVLSAIGFGAMAIFARFAYLSGAEVIAVLFLRFLFAGLLLMVLMMVTKRAWPGRRSVLILMAMGGIGYVAQSYSFFAALQHASAGLVSLLLYLYPVLVAVLGAVILKEPLGSRRFVAVCIAFVGTVLTLWGAWTAAPLGIALGVLSALLYSIYILVGSRVLATEDPIGSGTVVILSAAAVFGLLVLLIQPVFPSGMLAWSSVVAISVFSTVVGMVGFFIGMRHLGAADAATLSTLEPAVTILLAGLFLQESLSAVQLIGGAVILFAVIWLVRMPKTAR